MAFSEVAGKASTQPEKVFAKVSRYLKRLKGGHVLSQPASLDQVSVLRLGEWKQMGAF